MPLRKQKAIKSVVVHVVGESFIGSQYSKRIVVTSVDSNYVLDASCFKCKCPKIEAKKLEAAVADEFLKLIESLQDGGHMASCCDHPYTEVEIAYNDGTLRKLTLSFDISKTGKDQDKGFPGVEKVLKIECDTTKVAG